MLGRLAGRFSLYNGLLLVLVVPPHHVGLSARDYSAIILEKKDCNQGKGCDEGLPTSRRLLQQTSTYPEPYESFHLGMVPRLSRVPDRSPFVVSGFVGRFFSGDNLGMVVLSCSPDLSLGQWQWSSDGQSWTQLSSGLTPEDITTALCIAPTFEGIFDLSDDSSSQRSSLTVTASVLGPGHQLRFVPAPGFNPDPGGTPPWDRVQAMRSTRLIFAAWDTAADDSAETMTVFLPNCGKMCGKGSPMSDSIVVMGLQWENASPDVPTDCNNQPNGNAYWDCGMCVTSPVTRDCAKQCGVSNREVSVDGTMQCLPAVSSVDNRTNSTDEASGPPVVTSVRLTQDWRRLSIEFDRPVEGPRDCRDIFDDTSKLLGDEPKCIFGGRKVLVTLGVGAGLDAGVKLKFRDSVRSSASNEAQFASGEVTVPGSQEMVPEMDVSYPLVVCDDAAFHVTFPLIEGVGARPMSFNWTVLYDSLVLTHSRKHNLAMWDSVRELQKRLVSAGPQYKYGVIELDGSKIRKDMTYKVSVIGENFRGKKTGIQAFVLRRSDSEPATLNLRLIGPNRIQPEATLVLETQLYSCQPGPLKVNYFWSVNSSDIATLVQSLSGRTLMLEPETMRVGVTYEFSCIVVLETNLTVFAKASRIVYVTSGGVTARVSPASLVIGVQNALVLDTSGSSDLDATPGNVTYSWECNVAGSPCMVSPNGDPPTRLESDIIGSVLADPVLRIPPNTLAVERYTFVVTVSKGSVQSKSQASVTVLPGLLPVTTTAVGPSRSVDPNTPFQIDGFVSSSDAVEAVWERSLGNTWSEWSRRNLQGSASQHRIPLVVHSLLPGADYSFRLRADRSDSTVSVSVAVPPQPGSFRVEPNDGESLRTVFKFSARGWYSESMPMTHYFGYRLSQEEDMRVLHRVTADMPDADGYLPDGSCVPVLRVCDTYQICTTVEAQNITTKPPGTLQDNDVQSLKDRIDSLSVQAALTLSQTVLLTIPDQQDTFRNVSSHVEDTIRRSIARNLLMQINQGSIPIRESITVLKDMVSTLSMFSPSDSTVTKVLRCKRAIVARTTSSGLTSQEVRSLLRSSELALKPGVSSGVRGQELQRLLDDVPKYLGQLCLAPSNEPIIKVQSPSATLGMQLTSGNANSRWTVPISDINYAYIGSEISAGLDSWNCMEGSICHGVCLGTAAFPEDYVSQQLRWENRRRSALVHISLHNPVTGEVLQDLTFEKPFSLEIPLNTTEAAYDDIRCLWWNKESWSEESCTVSGVQSLTVSCMCRNIGYFGVFNMSGDIKDTERPAPTPELQTTSPANTDGSTPGSQTNTNGQSSNDTATNQTLSGDVTTTATTGSEQGTTGTIPTSVDNNQTSTAVPNTVSDGTSGADNVSTSTPNSVSETNNTTVTDGQTGGSSNAVNGTPAGTTEPLPSGSTGTEVGPTDNATQAAGNTGSTLPANGTVQPSTSVASNSTETQSPDSTGSTGNTVPANDTTMPDGNTSTASTQQPGSTVQSGSTNTTDSTGTQTPDSTGNTQPENGTVSDQQGGSTATSTGTQSPGSTVQPGKNTTSDGTETAVSTDTLPANGIVPSGSTNVPSDSTGTQSPGSTNSTTDSTDSTLPANGTVPDQQGGSTNSTASDSTETQSPSNKSVTTDTTETAGSTGNATLPSGDTSATSVGTDTQSPGSTASDTVPGSANVTGDSTDTQTGGSAQPDQNTTSAGDTSAPSDSTNTTTRTVTNDGTQTQTSNTSPTNDQQTPGSTTLTNNTVQPDQQVSTGVTSTASTASGTAQDTSGSSGSGTAQDTSESTASGTAQDTTGSTASGTAQDTTGSTASGTAQDATGSTGSGTVKPDQQGSTSAVTSTSTGSGTAQDATSTGNTPGTSDTVQPNQQNPDSTGDSALGSTLVPNPTMQSEQQGTTSSVTNVKTMTPGTTTTKGTVQDGTTVAFRDGAQNGREDTDATNSTSGDSAPASNGQNAETATQPTAVNGVSTQTTARTDQVTTIKPSSPTDNTMTKAQPTGPNSDGTSPKVSDDINAPVTPKTPDDPGINATFSLEEDYDAVVRNRKEKFESLLTNQLATLLRASPKQIANLRVYKGSIIVTLQLVVDPDGGGRTPQELYDDLMRLLAERKLLLTGFDNESLRTALVNLDQVAKGSSSSVTESTAAIIGGVTGGVVILLIVVVSIAVFIYKRKRKRRAGSVQPLQAANRSFRDGVVPTYRPVKFEHTLESGALQVTRRRPLLPPIGPPTIDIEPVSPARVPRRYSKSIPALRKDFAYRYSAPNLPGTPEDLIN